METLAARILLVEDFKPYRSAVRSMLSSHPEWAIVCETEDGIEAIAQAEQLKPDVILMDIGLPKLNGLDAARQICELVPSAKIVFLTQETDIDVIAEAFRVGAWGFVFKQEAQADLPAALTAVLQGKQFVTRGLGDYV